MTNRLSREGKMDRARHLAGLWTRISRLKGIPWVEAGRIRLFQPSDLQLVDQHRLLPHLLGTLPTWSTLAPLIGNPPCEWLTSDILQSTRLALQELEQATDLDELIDEGVRPVRFLREVDRSARFQEAHLQIENARGWLQSLGAATSLMTGKLETPPDKQLCIQALPLRVASLGNWIIDPLDWLPILPNVEPVLKSFLLQQTDRITRNVAEGLFDQIHHRQDPRIWPAFLAVLLPQNLKESLHRILDLEVEPRQMLFRFLERSILFLSSDLLHHLIRSLPTPLQFVRSIIRSLERVVSPSNCRSAIGTFHPSNEEEALQEYEPEASVENNRTKIVNLAKWFIHEVRKEEIGDPFFTRDELEAWIDAYETVGWRTFLEHLTETWKVRAIQRKHLYLRRWQSEWTTRFQFALLYPELSPRSTSSLNRVELESLSRLIEGIYRPRVEAVWTTLIANEVWTLGDDDVKRAIRSNLSPRQLGRILNPDVLYRVIDWCDDVERVENYLDVRDQLLKQPIPGLDPSDEWFLKLFRSGSSWVGPVALSLLHKPKRDRDLMQLLGIIQSLENHPFLAEIRTEWATAVDDWNSIRVINPPENYFALNATIGMGEQLKRYLHYRRLAGEGEQFSNAILEVLQSEGKLAGELQYLHRALAKPDLEPKKRDQLEYRLHQLNDPSWLDETRNTAIARTRNRIADATKEFEVKGLERTLDRLGRHLLEKIIGRSLPDQQLPDVVWDILYLQVDSNTDQDLLIEFILDQLNQRPRADRPLNREWLEKAGANGIKTDRWLKGFAVKTTVNQKAVRIETSHNPLEVIRMGSYFGTCLTLEDGCNRASTLINVLDVNKYVIYALDASEGKPLARKLILATNSGKLLGYGVYAHDEHDAFREVIDHAVTTFASACNLMLSNDGDSEQIHPGFWYDDGNTAWSDSVPTTSISEAATPFAVPTEFAGNEIFTVVWILKESLVDRDIRKWQYLIEKYSYLKEAEFAWFEIMKVDPPEAERILVRDPGFRQRVMHRAIRQENTELFEKGVGKCWDATQIQTTLCQIPVDPKLIQRMLPIINRRFASVQGRIEGYLPYPNWPRHIASASLHDLLESIRQFGRHSESWTSPDFNDSMRYRIDIASDQVETAWLIQKDPEPLLDALHESGTLVQSVVVDLLTRHAIPELAGKLRRMINDLDRERGYLPLTAQWHHQLALALGTQRFEWDANRLLQLQASHLTSIERTLAVIRTGNADAAALARERWQFPSHLLMPTSAPNSLEQIIELASPRYVQDLETQLSRLVRRYEIEPNSQNLFLNEIEPDIRAWIILGSNGDPERVERFFERFWKFPHFRTDQFEKLQQYLEPDAIEYVLSRLVSLREQIRGGGEAAIRPMQIWKRVIENEALTRHPSGVCRQMVSALKCAVVATTTEKRFEIASLLFDGLTTNHAERLGTLSVLLGEIKPDQIPNWVAFLTQVMKLQKGYIADPVVLHWLKEFDSKSIKKVMNASRLNGHEFCTYAVDYTQPGDPIEREKKFQLLEAIRHQIKGREGTWDWPRSEIRREWNDPRIEAW
jgi:hypothetical protein